MPTIKTKGIILKINDTPGKDKAIRILTGNGLISAFMTPRRTAGKKSYTVDLFTCGEIILYKTDSGNYLVNSVTPDETFFGLGNDIARLAAAAYFAQLAISATDDADTDTDELFTLVITAIGRISQGESIKRVKPAFEFRIARLMGFAPCLEADKKSNTYYFDLRDGRLYSEQIPQSVRLNRTAVLCIYGILNADAVKVFDFTDENADIDDLYTVAQQYIEYQTERDYDTLRFLNGVI